MKVKPIVAIGLFSLAIAGVGIYLYRRNKKESEALTEAQKKKDEEEAAKIAATTIKTSPELEPVYPATGFTQLQGDAFRAWMNSLFPKTSQNLSLDRTGSPDNKFIRKAFALKGAEYKKYLSSQQNTAFDREFRKKYLGGLFT